MLLGGVARPVSGEVGGDAEGVRSRFGFSPTRFESHAAVSPVSRTNAHSPVKSVLISVILRGTGRPYPLISIDLAIFWPAFASYSALICAPGFS